MVQGVATDGDGAGETGAGLGGGTGWAHWYPPHPELISVPPRLLQCSSAAVNTANTTRSNTTSAAKLIGCFGGDT